MTKVAIFSAQSFDKKFLSAANKPYGFDLVFFEASLTPQTVELAKGFTIVSCFVTDNLNADVLRVLAQQGTKFIALRSAGFNHIDLVAAQKYNLTVTRVSAYSPYAVAEFAVGLILSLNRKIHHAYNRVREQNFSLEGLLGFDIHGKTVGIIGTGKIGEVFCNIMRGFGVTLLGHDPIENPDCLAAGLTYTSLDNLYRQSDIISLHCPLQKDTQHLINAAALDKMKPGVMLINTGRGALMDARAVIVALKAKKIGALGIDVYEEEEGLFFHDLSTAIIQDDVFARLQTFPNVLITSHQAFFTQEALLHIVETTLKNIQAFINGTLTDYLKPG